MSSEMSETEMSETYATFTIEMTPGDPALDSTARFDFTKIWSGAIVGTSRGVMLSGGDPQQGNAGYVAMEVFEGTIDGLKGTIAMHQFGSMHGGDYSLRYEVVPGSGTNQLAGMIGAVDLNIDDGQHKVTLRYRS
jgi:Protein of unknown function (DUF3224)